jgi:putative membrane protein
MQQNVLFTILIHTHIFIAGYLFTASILYTDQPPHRTSFYYRMTVLALTMAGHGILSKRIYAYPPAGVSAAEAEMGGMLMYYGGA